MKLPDAVIDKLRDRESPVTHAAIIDGVDMIISYSCDGKVIGQSMFQYAPETYAEWFRSMMDEMHPGTTGSVTRKKGKIREKGTRSRASKSHLSHSRRRKSRRRG
jgi:hypothetical protein